MTLIKKIRLIKFTDYYGWKEYDFYGNLINFGPISSDRSLEVLKFLNKTDKIIHHVVNDGTSVAVYFENKEEVTYFNSFDPFKTFSEIE